MLAMTVGTNSIVSPPAARLPLIRSRPPQTLLHPAVASSQHWLAADSPGSSPSQPADSPGAPIAAKDAARRTPQTAAGMVKGNGYEKGKGAVGKEKENGKAKTKEKSVNYLIRQDSPLPPPVSRKGKHKARIRKAKEFPNAPMGEFICSIKKHPPPPPRLPNCTGAGVRTAEAAASGLKLPHVSHVLHDEEKDEDAEDEDAEDEDKEYDEQNLFVVPPLQGGGDISVDDTSDGYKESPDELEGGDPMFEESLVHVVSSEDSEEEARERKKKKNKRPRANAPVRAISDVWAHFHKPRDENEEDDVEIIKLPVVEETND
ncbi:hypothetical protein ZWY2020_027004 [Hordeum vulgare]|nr:hypothetical protein ZWY2020_027004 [Hordeum vulgare]